MIQTKKKSRWRGQSFPAIGMIDNFYICRIAKDKYVRIHKSEVLRHDAGRNTGDGTGA